MFTAADDLIPLRPANLHLVLELAADIAATNATLPEPPASICALAAGNSPATLTALAQRLLRR